MQTLKRACNTPESHHGRYEDSWADTLVTVMHERSWAEKRDIRTIIRALAGISTKIYGLIT